ncbi:MAG: YfhO family protein [Paludibacteraceae bacterium]|nr:YfhO family protein [Paludibacteraceae bacterium]
MKKIDWKKLLPYLTAAVLFVGFAMLYCSPVLEGKTLQAGDVNNWKGAAQEAREYYKQTGETTFWTNSMFGGMPTYQITGSMPSGVLRNNMEKVARFGFAGDRNAIGLLIAYLFGFFFMLRCFRVNAWLSIAGAFALALSSYFFLIIPAGHITKAAALGFLAPIVGGFYAIFRKDYWLGAPLVVVYGILGITQHPQMTYYVVMLIGVLGIGEVVIHISERRWKDLGVGVGVAIVCALLVFGTKLSWFEMNNAYLKETMRGGHSELTKADEDKSKPAGLDIDYVTAWSYGKAETFTLLIPNFMGGASGYDVGEKSTLYDNLVKARVPRNSAKQFCQQVPTYWGEKAFTSGPVYVGAVVCLLFVLGLIVVPGVYKWALLAATIFSILLAWGRNFMPLTELFYNYFPMYNKFRAVESILIVAEITMPLLGLMGLQRIVESEDKEKMLRPLYIAAGITGGICLLFALAGSSLMDFTSSYDAQWKSQVGNDIYQMIVEERASMLTKDAWRSFAFIALAASALFIYMKGKMKFGYLAAITGVLVVADLVPVDRRFFGDKDFVTKRDSERVFDKQDWEEKILQDKSLDFRVLNTAANTFNDARTSYRLKSIGGYSAAKLRRYQDLIDMHISRNNWNVLNMLNTKYIVTRNGVMPNPEAMGNAWFVDSVRFVGTPDEESEALWNINMRQTAVADGRFEKVLTVQTDGAAEGEKKEASIALTSYAPNHLEYTASTDKDRVAVFSEIYYPHDWHLTIDGEEAELGRVNYVLRAAVIPAGTHQVAMSFIPAALKTDRWCLYGTILLLILSAASLAYPLWRGCLKTCRTKVC